ncbi:MAG: hypothetical protein V3T17_14325 [Pseudomonadales bacterium]
MTTINTLITNIVTHIKSDFPELVACEALAGYLETTTVDTLHANTPGLYIASVGSGEMAPVETGQRDITVQLVAYLILVNATDSLQREEDTQLLISNLLAYVGWNRWGLGNVHPAMAVESADVHGLTNDFQPHVKDWRLGVSVLARAADIYGSDNPVSNLALWAITWEQQIRVGDDLYDDSGDTTPTHLYVPTDSGDAYTALTTVAGGLAWTDADLDTGEISGTLTVTKANDESQITHYAVYWGESANTKLATEEQITLLEVTGSDLSHDFAADTAVPDGATHLLVYTQYNGLERSEYLSIALDDISNAAPTAITLDTSSIADATDTTGGVLIGTLTTTDEDTDDTATYSIVGGTDPLVFSITDDQLMIDDGILDATTQSSYAVTVRVTDSLSNTFDQAFTITVV